MVMVGKLRQGCMFGRGGLCAEKESKMQSVSYLRRHLSGVHRDDRCRAFGALELLCHMLYNQSASQSFEIWNESRKESTNARGAKKKKRWQWVERIFDHQSDRW